MSEQIFFSTGRMLARCRLCRGALYDGDTAYRLGGMLICPACVDDALIVCRPAEPEPDESEPTESAADGSGESEEAKGYPQRLPGNDGKDDPN